MKKILSKLSTS